MDIKYLLQGQASPAKGWRSYDYDDYDYDLGTSSSVLISQCLIASSAAKL
jgi:hypothetical protein